MLGFRTAADELEKLGVADLDNEVGVLVADIDWIVAALAADEAQQRQSVVGAVGFGLTPFALVDSVADRLFGCREEFVAQQVVLMKHCCSDVEGGRAIAVRKVTVVVWTPV